MEQRFDAKREVEKFGGVGEIFIQPLVSEENRGAHVRLFAKFTLPAGCSLGDHRHQNEREIYTILSGEGVYHDDDTEYAVKAGNVLVCTSGHGHGLVNNSDSDLVWIAAIILD